MSSIAQSHADVAPSVLTRDVVPDEVVPFAIGKFSYRLFR